MDIGIRVQIVPMTSADVPAIMRIEKSSHVEPWSTASFLEELQRRHSYVLLARVADESSGGCCGALNLPTGSVAGYLCFWVIADEIQILNVTVHQDCRRRGIARKLLVHAFRMGIEKNARLAVLEVRESNSAARALYESMGFRNVGERPDYYGVVREAAMTMMLDYNGMRALAAG